MLTHRIYCCWFSHKRNSGSAPHSTLHDCGIQGQLDNVHYHPSMQLNMSIPQLLAKRESRVGKSRWRKVWQRKSFTRCIFPTDKRAAGRGGGEGNHVKIARSNAHLYALFQRRRDMLGN